MPPSLTLLRHAAEQSGFDLDRGIDEGWFAFGSSQVPLRVWVRDADDGHLVALSQANVAQSLDDAGVGTARSLAMPGEANAVRWVPTRPGLHALLRRAFKLSGTLPNHLLKCFEKAVASLPRSTEAERLVVQRVGQDVFRGGLLDYWEGRCAVTGLAVPTLLRASHMKPWAVCGTDAERLDVFNGILLAAHLDAAFDAGLITFAENCTMVVSPSLGAEAVATLGWTRSLRLRRLEASHLPFLTWHREHVFVRGGSESTEKR